MAGKDDKTSHVQYLEQVGVSDTVIDYKNNSEARYILNLSRQLQEEADTIQGFAIPLVTYPKQP